MREFFLQRLEDLKHDRERMHEQNQRAIEDLRKQIERLDEKLDAQVVRVAVLDSGALKISGVVAVLVSLLVSVGSQLIAWLMWPPNK